MSVVSFSPDRRGGLYRCVSIFLSPIYPTLEDPNNSHDSQHGGNRFCVPSVRRRTWATCSRRHINSTIQAPYNWRVLREEAVRTMYDDNRAYDRNSADQGRLTGGRRPNGKAINNNNINVNNTTIVIIMLIMWIVISTVVSFVMSKNVRQPRRPGGDKSAF